MMMKLSDTDDIDLYAVRLPVSEDLNTAAVDYEYLVVGTKVARTGRGGGGVS